MKKVFISSTYVDLKDYREAANEVIQRYNCIALAMEHFGARAGAAETVCEAEVLECDLFVGIYAHRYGFVPKGKETSITQQEYKLAKKEGKECLCFIVEKSFPWNPEFFERKKYEELEAFLDTVKKENVTAFFCDVKDFESKLATSLGKWLQEKGTGQNIEGGCIIPKAPAPYIAHPYPLPDHFTGRDAEQAMLAEWFHNEQEPVLVLKAIGGMGKSALSWVWLHKDVMERSTQMDGIFWWSFYDEPFDSFIQHLYCYVFGEQDNTVGPVSTDMPRLMAVLQQRRFLLVLDGLERTLIGYAGMEAMFIQEKRFVGDQDAEWDKRLREPVHHKAAKFLKSLAQGKSKTLITTRLFPAPLEGLAGVKHVFLTGLSEEDAVSFLHSEGIKGTRAEMVRAGAVYDFHPLMLKLLSTAIRRSRAKDIKDAFGLNLIDRAEPHKILEQSFKLLSEEEREVVPNVAVFRGAFTFEAAKALFPGKDEIRLWQVLMELRGLGFLFYDDREQRFDFHPILRSFLYNGLSNPNKVHALAVEYFQALPKKENMMSLEDLAPVIELYHHLVKAGKSDAAWRIFNDRIWKSIYYQLSAYHLQIELLKELFPSGEDGEDRLPSLKEEGNQAWSLAALANSYALSGQPARAVPLYLMQNKLQEKNKNSKALAVGLGNVAMGPQLQIGQLSAAAGHLRKSMVIGQVLQNEFHIASVHRELGRVLAFRGETTYAANEFNQAFELAEKLNHIQNQGLIISYRSLCDMLQARITTVLLGGKKFEASHTGKVLSSAHKVLRYTEKDATVRHPHPMDFVRAYWLLGEALIQCGLSEMGGIEAFTMHFYDEHFQKIIETLVYKKGREWDLAERCLHEALRRCRKVNLVELEPDILLSLARLEKAKNRPGNAEPLLKEALDIAQRADYRLKLADIHLLCGEILLKDKNTNEGLLGFTAHEHLQKARDYALDVSELDDLYESPDPHFYDGIPEYQMLKRGMTKEERIRNGYYVAYQIAEALEKRI